jgi:hypothetical protein
LIYIAARKPLAMSLSSPHCLVSRVPSFLRQWMVWFFQTCGVLGIPAFPEGDNIFAWIGTIKGSLQLSMRDWPTSWHWSWHWPYRLSLQIWHTLLPSQCGSIWQHLPRYIAGRLFTPSCFSKFPVDALVLAQLMLHCFANICTDLVDRICSFLSG